MMRGTTGLSNRRTPSSRAIAFIEARHQGNSIRLRIARIGSDDPLRIAGAGVAARQIEATPLDSKLMRT